MFSECLSKDTVVNGSAMLDQFLIFLLLNTYFQNIMIAKKKIENCHKMAIFLKICPWPHVSSAR